MDMLVYRRVAICEVTSDVLEISSPQLFPIGFLPLVEVADSEKSNKILGRANIHNTIITIITIIITVVVIKLRTGQYPQCHFV